MTYYEYCYGSFTCINIYGTGYSNFSPSAPLYLLFFTTVMRHIKEAFRLSSPYINHSLVLGLQYHIMQLSSKQYVKFFALGGPIFFPSQSKFPFSVTLNDWRRGFEAFASTFTFGNIFSTPPINCFFARRLYVDQLTQCSKMRRPSTFFSFAPVTISGSKVGLLLLVPFFFFAGISVV